MIAPLPFRPRNGAYLLYRKPPYPICADPIVPLDRLLQAYVARWDLELNFRDDETPPRRGTDGRVVILRRGAVEEALLEIAR